MGVFDELENTVDFVAGHGEKAVSTSLTLGQKVLNKVTPGLGPIVLSAAVAPMAGPVGAVFLGTQLVNTLAPKLTNAKSSP